MIVRAICATLFTFLLAGCASAESAHALSGVASVYGHKGQSTASGEIANPDGLTAAHKTLPFGTRVQVTHVKSGKVVVVRINDRGPFVKGRVIDLSPRAAAALGFNGLAPVDLLVMN